MSDRLFKIRQISTGRFFAGSGYKKSSWSARGGKSYGSLRVARTSRSNAYNDHGHPDKAVNEQDTEIVEYEIVEVATHD